MTYIAEIITNIETGEVTLIEGQAPIPPVPVEVSRFQARAALMQAGLLSQADAAVAASGNALLQLAWADAVSFKRNSPGIASLAPALGLDDADLDDLFRAASEIVA